MWPFNKPPAEEKPLTAQQRHEQRLQQQMTEVENRPRVAAANREAEQAKATQGREAAKVQAQKTNQPGPAERLSYTARFNEKAQQALQQEREKQQTIQRDVAAGKRPPPPTPPPTLPSRSPSR